MLSDVYAAQLLHTYGHNDTAVPLAVSSDGNCFFNSLSDALTGSEDLAPHLWLRCAIYCLLHTDSLSHHEYNNNVLTPSLADDMTAICQDGGYSSFRVFVAAAEALQCKIEPIYLPVNGSSDQVCGMLNRNITLSVVSSSTWAADITEVRIMRSRTQPPDSGVWVPNHFVPLVHQSSFPNSNHRITSGGENDDLTDDLNSTCGNGRITVWSQKFYLFNKWILRATLY